MNLKHFFQSLKSSEQGKFIYHHSFTKSNICNKLFWNSEEIFYSLRKLLIKSNPVINEYDYL